MNNCCGFFSQCNRLSEETGERYGRGRVQCPTGIWLQQYDWESQIAIPLFQQPKEYWFLFCFITLFRLRWLTHVQLCNERALIELPLMKILQGTAHHEECYLCC